MYVSRRRMVDNPFVAVGIVCPNQVWSYRPTGRLIGYYWLHVADAGPEQAALPVWRAQAVRLCTVARITGKPMAARLRSARRSSWAIESASGERSGFGRLLSAMSRRRDPPRIRVLVASHGKPFGFKRLPKAPHGSPRVPCTSRHNQCTFGAKNDSAGTNRDRPNHERTQSAFRHLMQTKGRAGPDVSTAIYSPRP